MLFSVDTTVRGRFSEKRCGPSRRCARNASAALENFVCYPQKTFSTASVKTGKAQWEDMFSALPLRADIAQCSRHVRLGATNSNLAAVGANARGRNAAFLSLRPVLADQ